MTRKQTSSRYSSIVLIAGDVAVLALVTVSGSFSHGLSVTEYKRMSITFISLLVAWFLIAPHLRVFDDQRVVRFDQLWRPLWAMTLAAPFAAWLRGILLQAPVIPVFVVVLGGVSALALLVWRGIYLLVMTRVRSLHG